MEDKRETAVTDHTLTHLNVGRLEVSMAMESFHGQQTVPMLPTVPSPSAPTWQSSSQPKHPLSRNPPEPELECSNP